MKRISVTAVLLLLGPLAGIASAQVLPGVPASSVSRSVQAIGYTVGGGGTKINLKASEQSPQASGQAKVEAKKAITNIQAQVTGMAQPGKLGTEFLTYVLWAVSPDGRTSNLGEILINNAGDGKLNVTTQMQTFSLFVTAEPYFSVRRPSELVVLENELLKGTKGKVFTVNDYQLMKREQYQKMGNPLALTLDLKNVPLDMYEARNAVEIARSREADRYAPDIFNKAASSLKMAENSLARKANKNQTITTARQSVQFSEDARALSVERQDAERITREREAAAARAREVAEAKAAVEAAEAKRRTDAEARQQAELAAAKEGQMKAEAEGAAARAQAAADAAAAKAQAEADALTAKERAAEAAAEQARKAAEELRAQLLDQFNRILETRDTPRGLVVNMADVLFDTGKYDLRPPTREKLAKLTGIVLAHLGLDLAVEGHTDTTGSDEFNQKLSEQRADIVRSFLIQQGLSNGSVMAHGFGSSMPIADNSTAAGRQQNRRVEIIISGEVIGAKIGN